jgi:hypothetical protein
MEREVQRTQELKDSRGFTAVMVALAASAALILVYDIWEVASGNADLTRHLPFFLPAVFVTFMLIIWKIEKILGGKPPCKGGRDG